jgi:hypothetical protein
MCILCMCCGTDDVHFVYALWDGRGTDMDLLYTLCIRCGTDVQLYTLRGYCGTGVGLGKFC